MAAYRCTTCSENWPLRPTFHTCPKCTGVTWPAHNVEGPDVNEAESRRKRLEFERYYEQRELAKFNAEAARHLTERTP